MSTTGTSSSASLTTSEKTKDKYNSGLGTLATLPREIRDEIYGYIFSGLCKAIYSSTWKLLNIPDRRLLTKLRESGVDLTMLQLSKAINHEAAAVLYSEGVFLCSLIFKLKLVCLPQASIDRMMRIELDVYAGLGSLCYNEAWKSIMKKLNSAGLVRKSIHVNFQDYFSLNLIAVPDMMSKELRTLICYRTVIVEFSTTDLREAGVSESHADGTKIVVASLRLFAEAVLKGMQSALGPATLSHTKFPGSTPGYPQHSIRLQFHPQEHMAINSDALVDKQS